MIEITRASIADVTVLTGLIEQYRAFYKQESNAKTEGYLRDRLANDEAIIFIARQSDSGEAVGFTTIYPTFSTVSLSNIWLLNDLFVTESARGKHVATALMETAENVARDAGATRIWLRTANDNLPGQALYEGRGWAQDTIFRRYDLIF